MKKRWKAIPGLTEGFMVASFGNSGLDGKDWYVVTDHMRSSELCDTDSDAKTDAILCAAAPDLLEALKDVIGDCRCSVKERYSGHLVDCSVPHALEVIAKAEGKSETNLGVKNG